MSIFCKKYICFSEVMGVGRIWRPWARYILLALTYMGVYEHFGVYVIDNGYVRYYRLPAVLQWYVDGTVSR